MAEEKVRVYGKIRENFPDKITKTIKTMQRIRVWCLREFPDSPLISGG